MKTKSKTILVDLHGTLLTNGGKPNKPIVDMVKQLSNIYHVTIFTADNVNDLPAIEQKIKSTGIAYSGFYYQRTNENDVDKKLRIFDEISKTHKVVLIIDNNKKVCKALRDKAQVLRVMI